MLSRSQIYALFMPSSRIDKSPEKMKNGVFSRYTVFFKPSIPPEKKETTNIFSELPLEIIQHISDFDESPDSDFAKALKHVAYGELNEAQALLEKDPRLVLYAGTVVTPAGLTVKRATLLECALGAGDPEMAAMILPYFSKIKDENGNLIAKAGKKERAAQLKRYQPHIENLLEQKPYDLIRLIEIIKKSSAEDVTKALNKDMPQESELCKALEQFRNDVRPKELIKPGMHYNYQTLIQACEMLMKEWNALKKGDTFSKCDLVVREVIGYLMEGLPEVDKKAIKGFDELVEYRKAVMDAGLVSAAGPITLILTVGLLYAKQSWMSSCIRNSFSNHLSSKNSQFIELFASCLPQEASLCVIS